MIGGRVQANRQNHHVECFGFYALAGSRIVYNDIFALRDLSFDGYIASDELHPGESFGPLKVSLKILAMGTDIVVENGTRGPGKMILCQDHLFLRIGTADPRTITVLPRGDPSGADTLNPGQFLGRSFVRRAQYPTLVWTGGGQQPFKVETGDHVFHGPVTIVFVYLRIKRRHAGGQNNGADGDIDLYRGLFKVDGVGLTYASADITFVLFEEKAAVIDIGHKGYGLGKIDMNGFVFRYFLVKGVRVFHRAVFYTGRTPRASILDNVSGLFCQGDLKVPGDPFDTVDFGKGENLYVWMPADLDQFG